MSWTAKLLEGDDGDAPLAPRIDALLTQQLAAWPAFAAGAASLASAEVRRLAAADGRVIVQANPGRRRSTHAAVDPQAVAARPCFLCPQNMPPEERGVAWRDLVALPNPFPILPRHLTIAARRHEPQLLAGRVATLLDLAHQLGEGWLAFYNGPRCGASAPDHFHLQACSAADVPLMDAFAADAPPLAAWTSLGRSALLFAGREPPEIAHNVEAAIAALALTVGAEDEPPINLLAARRGDRLHAALIPRAAHRPRCYHATGDDRLAVSPAALEMAGVLVVAEPDQLQRVDLPTVRAIFGEVGYDSPRFTVLMQHLRNAGLSVSAAK